MAGPNGRERELLAAAGDMAGLLSRREAAEVGLQHLLQVAGTPGAALYLQRDGRDEMVRTLYRGAGLTADKPLVLATGSLTGKLTEGMPFEAGELPRSEALRGQMKELGATWALPLLAREGLVGMVCFSGDMPPADVAEELVALAAIAANALQGAFRYEQALYDEASGLYSTRLLQLRLREELRRSVRYGRELSLVLLAPAGGNGADGTAVSRAVAEELRAAVRADIDLAARYGEAEVGLMLPDTGRLGATVLAERLREALGRAGEASIAVGIASYPDHGETPEELTEAAEAALREALAGTGGGIFARPAVLPDGPDYHGMRRGG